MAYATTPAASNTLSLDDVIARLSGNDLVEGILTIGTTSGNHLTAASDYDLVIVIAQMPEDLEPYGVTYIDGRFTDLLFVTSAQVKEILDLTEPVDSRDWLGRIILWFRDGTIAFDRHEHLNAAQRKVRAGACLVPLAGDGRSGWWRVNYNLAQTRRMLASEDPIYLTAAELRMALYGPPDLLFNYFDIRNLAWSGDKDAVRYLQDNDPDYLALFRRFITESDCRCRLALYEELAQRTVAPLGELWQAGTTALAVRTTDTPQSAVDRTLAFWDDLLTGSGESHEVGPE